MFTTLNHFTLLHVCTDFLEYCSKKSSEQSLVEDYFFNTNFYEVRNLKKIIKRKYNVYEGILSIILANEYLLTGNSSLPNEVKRTMLEYIGKLREPAGIEEE